MNKLGALIAVICFLGLACSSDDDGTPKAETEPTADAAVGNDSSVGSDAKKPKADQGSDAAGTCAAKPPQNILPMCLYVEKMSPCYFPLEGCGGGGNRELLATFTKDGDTNYQVNSISLFTSSTFGTPETSQLKTAIKGIPLDTEVTIVRGHQTITFKFFDNVGTTNVDILSITSTDCDTCPGTI